MNNSCNCPSTHYDPDPGNTDRCYRCSTYCNGCEDVTRKCKACANNTRVLGTNKDCPCKTGYY